MSPELEGLIELQRLDTTISDRRAHLAAHPQQLAEADGRLNDARQAVVAAKERLKVSQEERRSLEKDAALYQGRLGKYKDQLAAVKTNREYQAMQLEIETAQRELGDAEERVLEHMVADDGLTAEVKTLEATLSARQKEVEAQKTALASEIVSVEAGLIEAIASRAALVSKLDARVVAMYDRVSQQRKGIAICAATRDGLCSVCHVRMRPPVFQQVRQNNSVVQCESCQRILYYVPPPPPVEPPVVHAQ